MLQTIYRKVLPVGVRYRIAKLRTKRQELKAFQLYKQKWESGNYDKEYAEELNYMVNRGGRVLTFPYDWRNEYRNFHVDVFDEGKMKYVYHKGKKLFFPRRYSKRFIEHYYLSLIMEQDIRSPHCYFDGKENFEGKTFIDVGAAEGIIALDVVEYVKQIVLFECNKDWQEALRKTFEPWQEKTMIVSKFVGNENSNTSVTLDAQIKMAGIQDSLILKLDVEGNEKSVLQGAATILKDQVTDAYVCTYHRKDDFTELSEFLKTIGFIITSSPGYMFYGSGTLAGFRKGVIRARRDPKDC